MSTEAEVQSPEPIRKAIGLDEVARAFGLLAILAYLAGIVTVAVYAETLDISSPSLDLFKTRYILTGALVLATFFAPGAAIYAICHLYREAGEDPKFLKGRLDGSFWKRTALCGLMSLLAIFAWLCAFTALVDWSGDEFHLRVKVRLALVAPTIVSVLAGWFAYNAWVYGRRLDDPESLRASAHTMRAAAAMAAGVCALVFAVLFALNVYPQIQEQFGGGKPRHALITFTGQGVAEARAFGIPLQVGERTSQGVEILYQDDSSYTVRFDDLDLVQGTGKRTVQLDSDIVAGYSSDSKKPKAEGLRVVTEQKLPIPARENDRIEFVYSEAMDRASIFKKWQEKSFEVTVRIAPLDNNPGLMGLTVSEAGSEKRLRVGTVVLLGDEIPTVEARGHIRQNFKKLTVWLDDDLLGADRSRLDIDRATWRPAETATDKYKNNCDVRFTERAEVVKHEEA